MEGVQKEASSAASLRRLAIGLVLVYVAAVALFYFLAGEQLHLRQSRDNMELPVADSGTVELVSGSIVEQRFLPKYSAWSGSTSSGGPTTGPTPELYWRS